MDPEQPRRSSRTGSQQAFTISEAQAAIAAGDQRHTTFNLHVDRKVRTDRAAFDAEILRSWEVQQSPN
jgi:hypothetical protein